MSRINIGGGVNRPSLRRDLGSSHTQDTEPSALPPAPDVVPSHLPTDINEDLAKTLAEEHHAGQPIDVLALRWGLDEKDVRRAITGTGSTVNQ